ncbi:Uncharacterised protein [uncultured archaeon]|nr:Uncharacterised protein [uncultured archaeon]
MVSFVIILLFVVLSICGIQWLSIGEPKERLNIDYLEAMQLNPTEDYIQRLERIISKNNDPYLIERAIFILTDIALRKNQSDKIIFFLKNIAMNEENDMIRTAAYANIDLIRTVHPLEKVGSMGLAVNGKIQKGENINIIARISSTIPVTNAVIGINRLHKDIEILSSPTVKINISKNEHVPENQLVTFKLRLKEAGLYKIPVSLLMSIDRIDYSLTYKYIYLNVSSMNPAPYDAVHIES